MSVVVETTVGDFTVDLFLDERPKTCMNFLKLCKRKYYNYNLIFSVDRNFVAQTGDPTGTGKGGSSIYQLTDGEKAKYYGGETIPKIRHTKMGLISMAACGDGMYGSQFFITLGEELDSLDAEHLVFGELVEGLEILDKLNQALIDETKRPYQDILITHTTVLNDPFPDPEGLEFPPSSPPPPDHTFKSNYISADEQLEDGDIKSLVEIQEEIEEKEAKARATILEMVGDLPSADLAPPENVLFVCKLNPVTSTEDLEVIFSRFGKVNCAEVIRDHVTGNSLQYAFVEFDQQKNCEDAYFKMDNVLIDDRRIHVDFSQSVSKIKWRGKGRGIEYFDDRGRRTSAKESRFNPNFQSSDPPKPKRPTIDSSKASDPLAKSNSGRHQKSESRGRMTSEHRSRPDSFRQKRSRSRSPEHSPLRGGEDERERKKLIKKLKKQLKKQKKHKKEKKKKSKKKRKSSSSSSSSSED